MMMAVLVVGQQCVYDAYDARDDDGGGVEARVGSGVGDFVGSSGEAVVDDVESSYVGVGGATEGGE